MEKKVSIGTIIGGIALIIIGIAIISFKTSFVKIIVITAGVAAFADGLYTIFKYREWKFSGVTATLTLVKGILMVVSGILGVIMPLVAANAVVYVVVFVFAIMLVFSAVVSVQNAIVLKKALPEIPRTHFYVEALFSLLIAVIFFTDPSTILNAFVTVIGILIITIGAGFIVYSILNKK